VTRSIGERNEDGAELRRSFVIEARRMDEMQMMNPADAVTLFCK
jgi:hypothetical protein